MLKEASLLTKAGVPLWVRSSGPSVVSGVLTSAMLSALSIFSTEITGQTIRSIEMTGGYKLHVRPFYQGEINLAIIGDESLMSDPTLMSIIGKLESDIQLMVDTSDIDSTDTNTIQVYLEESIDELDDWFGQKVFVDGLLQRERNEQVVEISSKITMMETRFSQENIGVLILDSSFQALYSESTDIITEEFFGSFQSQFRGWMNQSDPSNQLLPIVMYFDDVCVGIGFKKTIYIICAIKWKGSVGDHKTTSKVRSWISLLSRRLG